jgi:hypothetical protein
MIQQLLLAREGQRLSFAARRRSAVALSRQILTEPPVRSKNFIRRGCMYLHQGLRMNCAFCIGIGLFIRKTNRQAACSSITSASGGCFARGNH